jgi:HEAT repeats
VISVVKILLAVMFLFASVSRPPGRSAEQISSAYNTALLTFYMTVANPSDSSQLVTKVGVHSRAIGVFRCAATSIALTPLADYRIHFEVGDKETMITANPPIVVAPHSFARFTISLIPSATGACGGWEAYVSVFALFNNGTTLSSITARITDADVKAFMKRIPSASELLAAVRDRDPRVRAQAVPKIPYSHLSPTDKKLILEARLNDPAPDVRAAAALAAAAVPLPTLLPKIMSAILHTDKGYDRDPYYHAIGNLKDPRAAPFLLKRLLFSNDELGASAALKTIDAVSMLPLIRRTIALFPNRSRSEYETMKLEYLIEVLIWYRQPQDASLVGDFVRSPETRKGDFYYVEKTINALRGRMDNTINEYGDSFDELDNSRDKQRTNRRLDSDPFFHDVAPAVRSLANDRDEIARRAAREFLDDLVCNNRTVGCGWR